MRGLEQLSSSPVVLGPQLVVSFRVPRHDRLASRQHNAWRCQRQVKKRLRSSQSLVTAESANTPARSATDISRSPMHSLLQLQGASQRFAWSACDTVLAGPYLSDLIELFVCRSMSCQLSQNEVHVLSLQEDYLSKPQFSVLYCVSS